MDHIKEFNQGWDYFKGMSDKEVCDFLKSDMTWHRPTQSFSAPDNFFNVLWNNALNEKTNFLNIKFRKKTKEQANFTKKDMGRVNILNLL